jgi:tagatose 6-phosphate kinase
VILSAGLTPAWQQILVFDNYRHGEVNRAREAVWVGSGKVFNAGLAAHHLGGPSLTLAAVGGPPLKQINAEFDALGLKHRWVETQAATRVCTTILDRATGTMTELVEDGRPMLTVELDRFEKAYAEEVAAAKVAVLIGSLPAGTPDDFYGRLMRTTSCPAIIDARCEPLLEALPYKPLLVKPNRVVLGHTVGRDLDDNDELLAAMKDLNSRGADWVLISDSHRPAWLTSVGETFCFHPPVIEEVVNPIGCGDAMAGAIAWAVRDGRDMVSAVRLGIAAACDNLGQLLPCRLNLARIETMVDDVRLEKVS